MRTESTDNKVNPAYRKLRW